MTNTLTNLITEARELCEKATPGVWTVSGSKGQIIDSALSLNEYDMKSIVCDIWRDVEGNAAFIARSRTLIPELCDALEKAQEQNKQLIRELSALARESVERDMALAMMEAEVMAVTEPKRGEWVEAKSGVMSVYPPGQVMCSVCKQRMPSQWKKMPPYCYGCGARMDGEP